MTILTLQYFLTVAEELNVTTAAKKLYITQQTLSAHIKRLEEEYGVALFERKPKFQLTPAGRRVLHYARRIVRLERLMASELVDVANEKAGSLIVACSRVRAKSFLPQIWIEYHKLCPNINIRVMNGYSQDMNEFVRSRKTDLCITLHDLPEQGLMKYPILKEQLYFIVSPELFHLYYPEDTAEKFEQFRNKGITWKDIRNIPLLMLSPYNRIREAIDSEFDKMDYIPRVQFETADSETLMTMALSGCGATILFESTVFYTSEQLTKELSKVFVFPVAGSEFNSMVTAPADISLPHYQQIFIEVCQQVFSRAKVKMTIREQEYYSAFSFR